MLIPLDELIYTYDLHISGVLHVGAHLGEEYAAYQAAGIKDVLWVEGNSDLIPQLKANVPGHRVVNAVVGESPGQQSFYISNYTECSSLLTFGTHKETSPQAETIEVRTVEVVTLASLLDQQQGFEFNFINLDIQGAELLALKGLGSYLDGVECVYTEVNKQNVYEQCALVEALDEFLDGFKRRRTLWYVDGKGDHGWGDAFYVRP